MIKYLQIFHLTLQEYLVYRLSFILWRFRNFVSFLVIIFFWLAVYGSQKSFLGYEKSQMLTYLVGIAFLRGLVLSSRTEDLGRMIRDGDLSRIILTPVNVFKVFLSRDFADKLFNIVFAILEILLAFSVFNFSVYLPQKVEFILWSVISVGLAFFLYFYLNMVLSIIAFWTDDIWSTRWLFGIILLEFCSGAIFPVDVLPGWLAKIIYLTPFPYLIFFPMKIWLGQMTNTLIMRTVIICGLWLLFFCFLANSLWKRGIKIYSAHRG